MEPLKGNVMFGQSGGPTSVINSSAAGVFTEALNQKGLLTKFTVPHMGSSEFWASNFTISVERTAVSFSF